MSIILSTGGKDQLLLDGFRYRRDKLIWRFVEDNCEGRAQHDGTIYEIYQSHSRQKPNPEEIVYFLYMYTWLFTKYMRYIKLIKRGKKTFFG
jgi:hypothetical protein